MATRLSDTLPRRTCDCNAVAGVVSARVNLCLGTWGCGEPTNKCPAARCPPPDNCRWWYVSLLAPFAMTV